MYIRSSAERDAIRDPSTLGQRRRSRASRDDQLESVSHEPGVASLATVVSLSFRGRDSRGQREDPSSDQTTGERDDRLEENLFQTETTLWTERSLCRDDPAMSGV